MIAYLGSRRLVVRLGVIRHVLIFLRLLFLGLGHKLLRAGLGINLLVLRRSVGAIVLIIFIAAVNRGENSLGGAVGLCSRLCRCHFFVALTLTARRAVASILIIGRRLLRLLASILHGLGSLLCGGLSDHLRGLGRLGHATSLHLLGRLGDLRGRSGGRLAALLVFGHC